MIDDQNCTPEVLLSNEQFFLNLCPPKHCHTSEEVIGTSCCTKNCVLYITRSDVLKARMLYVSFYNSLPKTAKDQARYLFIATLKRGSSEGIFLVKVMEEWPVCLTVISRTFGMSVYTLIKGLQDEEFHDRPLHRDYYQKTVENVAKSVYLLTKNFQINSLQQLMLPPRYSTRAMDPDSKIMPLKQIRQKMGLKIRQRKSDSLVRCSICIGLADQIKKCPSNDTTPRKLLQSHHKIVNKTRTIIQCLNYQSRDEDFDLLVINTDSMSNKHTKLPLMIQRPKIITDNDRLTLHLTTIQFAQQTASSKFLNFDYVSMAGLVGFDSNYNGSILIDALSKLDSLPSTLVLIADSARNNKCHLMIGILALLLHRVKHLKEIRMLFPPIGHTHSTVDGHFGSVSTKLKESNAMTVDEFTDVVRTLNGCGDVSSAPTIFDFNELLDKMHRPGEVHWSSASTMCSLDLFHTENNNDTFKCFKDDFNPENFIPTIRQPAVDIVKQKIDSVLNVAGAFYTEDQKKSLYASLKKYPKQSFIWMIMKMNGMKPKVPPNTCGNFDQKHETILQFLEKSGYHMTKFPKHPIVDRSME